MGTTTALLLVILGVTWVALLLLTFRAPDAPKITRLLFFQALLVVTFILGYVFLVKVFHYNPNPNRVSISRLLTGNRTIYLGDFVPGLYDLDYIHRIDTDEVEEDPKEEWLAFYQYDVHTPSGGGKPLGPYGGAIYDLDRCRPPVIHSFELVPLSYDYLGQDDVDVVVENIIEYNDPLSPELRDATSPVTPTNPDLDLPEVIITGVTNKVVTDLNIFRRVGGDTNCLPRRVVSYVPPPGQTVTSPYSYWNIGSFRGTYQIERDGSVVTVRDSAGFERSQIVATRVYTPTEYGTYLKPGDPPVLIDPIEVGLGFGPGQPDKTRQVYYPEKTVLAFYLDLGEDPGQAMSYYACEGKGRSAYRPEDFGLTLPLSQLDRVAVCEIRYVPDIEGEQNHETQIVRAKVVEVHKSWEGAITCEQAHEVECEVHSKPNSSALPYGCEWCIYECRPYP